MEYKYRTIASSALLEQKGRINYTLGVVVKELVYGEDFRIALAR